MKTKNTSYTTNNINPKFLFFYFRHIQIPKDLYKNTSNSHELVPCSLRESTFMKTLRIISSPFWRVISYRKSLGEEYQGCPLLFTGGAVKQEEGGDLFMSICHANFTNIRLRERTYKYKLKYHESRQLIKIKWVRLLSLYCSPPPSSP